jgi:hypothetical protein
MTTEAKSAGNILQLLTEGAPALRPYRDELVAVYIVQLLKEEHGTVAKDEVAKRLCFLEETQIERCLRKHATNVYEVEVGGIPCWRDATAGLPDNLALRLTDIVDTLRLIERSVTYETLDLALSLAYREKFREVHGLGDNAVFRRVVEANYKGAGKVFTRRDGGSGALYRNQPVPEGVATTPSGKRTPTRFRDIGLPVGTVLTFVRDHSISCTVVDGANKVRYRDEIFSISTLSLKVLQEAGERKLAHGVAGPKYWLYGDETLWERRLRMESNESPSLNCNQHQVMTQ